MLRAVDIPSVVSASSSTFTAPVSNSRLAGVSGGPSGSLVDRAFMHGGILVADAPITGAVVLAEKARHPCEESTGCVFRCVRGARHATQFQPMLRQASPARSIPESYRIGGVVVESMKGKLPRPPLTVRHTRVPFVNQPDRVRWLALLECEVSGMERRGRSRTASLRLEQRMHYPYAIAAFHCLLRTPSFPWAAVISAASDVQPVRHW